MCAHRKLSFDRGKLFINSLIAVCVGCMKWWENLQFSNICNWWFQDRVIDFKFYLCHFLDILSFSLTLALYSTVHPQRMCVLCSHFCCFSSSLAMVNEFARWNRATKNNVLCNFPFWMEPIEMQLTTDRHIYEVVSTIFNLRFFCFDLIYLQIQNCFLSRKN